MGGVLYESRYILHASEENPRNSEGAFLQLKDGRIMYAWSRFRGSGKDWAPSDIAALFSRDGGRTWGGQRTLVRMEEEGLSADPEETGACPQNIMSVSLLRLRSGECALFYIVRRGWNDMSLYMRRSADECASFGPSLRMAVPLGYNAVLNDSAVMLSDGRIAVPVYVPRSRYAGFGTAGDDNALVQAVLAPNSQVYYLLSDDEGRTWRESAGGACLSVGWTGTGLQEPGVLELSPGILWSWARTDQRCQYEMFSMDNGETWSDPRPAQYFPSAVSPMRACRAPDGTLYAVWNPVPMTYDERFAEKGAPVFYSRRSPLAVAKSTDNGRTWSTPKTVDALPDGEPGCVEYPALYPLDDALLVAYDMTAGTEPVMAVQRIPYSRI